MEKQALTDEAICGRFQEAGDFERRQLKAGECRLYGYFLDGITSGEDIAQLIFRPLTDNVLPGTEETVYRQAVDGRVYAASASEAEDLETVCQKLLNGFCVILFPELGRALAFEAKTGEKRGVSEPEVEKTAKGPKDAFTETMRTNTGLLRRHLRTTKLRLWESAVGVQCRTGCTVAWLQGAAEGSMVERVKARLRTLEAESVVSPAAAEEFLTGSRATAFPLTRGTQRTDVFARGLLEGKVGVLFDGLPVGYLLPVSLADMMESPEDRTTDFLSASFLRLLRYAALLSCLFLPACYIAMAEFHQEMLPTRLLLAMIESRRSVPFPTGVEVLGLLLAFELLQQAGLQLPQSVGQSVSIIGGLVVGSAAVEAKLISPAALIVVAAAGICGYALSNQDLAAAVRLWRLGLSLCAAAAGMFGIAAGALALLIHLAGLESMGESYLSPFSQAKGGKRLVRRRLTEEENR